jgi:hypothetical protein
MYLYETRQIYDKNVAKTTNLRRNIHINTKPKSIKYKTKPYLTQNPTTFTSNWGNENKNIKVENNP